MLFLIGVSTTICRVTGQLQANKRFPVDLSIVSSVVSNVSATPDDTSSTAAKRSSHPFSSTKITILGHLPARAGGDSQKDHSRARSGSRTTQKETALLTLRPQSASTASEWLDGLLMLLNQQPITAETNKLIDLVSTYGLKIRLLNIRFDDAAFAGEVPAVPSREGLDDDYYYDVFGGA